MLTQLRNENIFDLRGEFNQAKKYNLTSPSLVAKDLCESIGFPASLSEDFENVVFKDQDGQKHLIFVRKGETLDKFLYKEFYNDTCGVGEMCRNTSDLLTQKKVLACTTREEDGEVSFLTVISVIKCCTHARPLAIMARFQHWLHSTNGNF